MWASTEVTVIEDGRPQAIETQASDVRTVLDDAGIELGDCDVVTPSPDSRVEKGMKIVVRHALPVVLRLGEESLEIEVVGETVADALVAVGMDPDANANVRPGLTQELEAGMTIVIPDVFVRVVQEEAEVEPGVLRQNDPRLEKGKTRLVQRGEPGKVLRVYRVIVAGGVESTRVLSAETVVKSAEQTVIAVGTARKPSLFALAKRRITIPKAPKGGSPVQMISTGYSSRQPGLGPRTATGALARRGVMAVDPRTISLGTRAYIPGYGYAVASDTGGAIHGNRIDLCFDTVAEAQAWGRRSVTVILLRQ